MPTPKKERIRVPLHVTIDPDLAIALDEYAEKAGESKSRVVEYLLNMGLKYYDR